MLYFEGDLTKDTAFFKIVNFLPLVCVNMSTESVWVNFPCWELIIIIIIIDCFLDFTDST